MNNYNENIRWKNNFNHSIAYELFIKHYTQLNEMYWANVPVINTIEKQVKEQFNGTNKPKDFFVISDEDERRLSPTFETWKKDYREFQNYNRCNTVLALSSCFEIYLRTIVSLSIESKPGIILGDKDIIDGAKLLKYNIDYINFGSKKYKFLDNINDICIGEWSKRIKEYRSLFESVPEEITNNQKELEKLRVLRNNIAHYLGREKSRYENPIQLKYDEIIRVTHNSLIKYFKLIYDVVKGIDNHLYNEYIGSYDILKYYVLNVDTSNDIPVGQKSKKLQKYIGKGGKQTVGTEYYKNLIKYYENL